MIQDDPAAWGPPFWAVRAAGDVEVFLYDAARTPFGRYAGALVGCRPDDLAAGPCVIARDWPARPQAPGK